MKGQLAIEFLAITVLMLIYLASVAGVYSKTRSELEKAVDKKMVRDISRWVNFIAGRPEGTLIKIDFYPYPGRSVKINCGESVKISAEKYSETLSIGGECRPLTFSSKSCLEIERIERGVKIEKC